MSGDLDTLLDTITELEADTFSWADAAVWTPGALVDDHYYGDEPQFLDDGCVVICDPTRPWVVTDYQPPNWAR